MKLEEMSKEDLIKLIKQIEKSAKYEANSSSVVFKILQILKNHA